MKKKPKKEVTVKAWIVVDRDNTEDIEKGIVYDVFFSEEEAREEVPNLYAIIPCTITYTL